MSLIFEEISKQHDRASFDCGVPPLTEFLKKFARQNSDDGISLTIVALDRPKPKTILGYYSVSSGQVEFASMPPVAVKGIPKYPIPVMRIGRLAVDLEAKGQGVGKELLIDAFHRAIEASKVLGLFAVVVDAKDANAKSFYQKYGFIEFLDNPMILFILMGTLKGALK
mgnify:FL=1